jgi:5'-deoxynucleotidase YfbR-like HD superfamily hydrolase/GNAT superfamily N-acetyltransferase
MRQRMEPRTLLDFMGVAERLKCNMRHSRTAENRRESVAEHTYRLCVFAWLVKEEFPDCDMDKVMRMSLFHDLGEAVTGDIPAFVKTDSDREVEESAISNVTVMLPERERKELDALFDELEKAETMEAKIVHALDKMEALIQHNEADIATWLPLEYDLQMTYGEKECKADPYLAKLREVIRQISADKIASEGEERGQSYYIRKGVENMHLEEVAALLHSTDWAKDRTEELIRKSMENACSYGLFLSDCISEGGKDRQIGFARVLTDGVTTFYLMDLVIEEAYRGQGFGTIMMNQIMKENGHLYGMLHTQTAKAFYERYGFREIGNTKKTEEIYMEKPCG